MLNLTGWQIVAALGLVLAALVALVFAAGPIALVVMVLGGAFLAAMVMS